MAQQFDNPKTETELRVTLDEIFRISKESYTNGERPSFKGLLEIMSAEATIVTAIHNIKSNHGSNTPGTDGKKMRDDYLYKPYEWVIEDIQKSFKRFEAQPIRRVYIDKPGKKEKRPLGIPTIHDRIIQECMRIVLDPLCEAQFFNHSYGFRPYRETAMALERINVITHASGYHWIVEGDISKCFDRIDHHILIKRLYHIGVKDRRVLMIIKSMLKAGIMECCEVNEEGTPQGGLISPLLANVYLDMMDEWITKQWENKTTSHHYAHQQGKYAALRNTRLIPYFLVRYADDFVVITDTKEHALDLKCRLQDFLKTNLKLELSLEKTLITDIRRNYIHFLGFEFKVVPGKAKKGYVARSLPNRDRLKVKVASIAHDIKVIPRNYSKEQLLNEIFRINSRIRGIIEYYQCCTWVNIAMRKYGRYLQQVAAHRLMQYKGKWVQARLVQNLPRVHLEYKQKIPSVKYHDLYVGVTSLTFCRWHRTISMNQNETPYSEEGRALHFNRTKKKRINARLDNLYKQSAINAATYGDDRLSNFEFIMNRAYALNRDKLKCRVCGKWLIDSAPYAHRINPFLSIDKVNRVNNLVSLHHWCFEAVNNPDVDISSYEKSAQKKIIGYRNKLVITHTSNK